MDIQKLIENIEAGKYSEEGLINLYKNASNNKKISEEEKEVVIEAIEKNTRLRFPRAAKRIFGAKESVAAEKLELFYKSLSTDFNLTSNKLKNGVKTGGRMISGEYYIDVYMSYKNINNYGAYISLTQKTIDDELVVSSGRYSTHNPNSGVENESVGGIDTFETHKDYYISYLRELAN